MKDRAALHMSDFSLDKAHERRHKGFQVYSWQICTERNILFVLDVFSVCFQTTHIIKTTRKILKLSSSSLARQYFSIQM